MSGDPEPYYLKKSWPSALLFGLKPWDLLTLTSAAAHLTVVTLVASLVPSMRAANLRAERAILVGRFTLTFDAQHGLLYLEPNASFDEPVPAPS